MVDIAIIAWSQAYHNSVWVRIKEQMLAHSLFAFLRFYSIIILFKLMISKFSIYICPQKIHKLLYNMYRYKVQHIYIYIYRCVQHTLAYNIINLCLKASFEEWLFQCWCSFCSSFQVGGRDWLQVKAVLIILVLIKIIKLRGVLIMSCL